MRADNKGEGGTLALMALAQRAIGRRSAMVFLLGVVGAALFYGDGIITPAVSVLSAVEGLKEAPGVGQRADALRAADRRRHPDRRCSWCSRAARPASASFFGPITALWFLILAGLGLLPHLRRPVDPPRRCQPALRGRCSCSTTACSASSSWAASSWPSPAPRRSTPTWATSAKAPIRAAWLVLVLPCLVLNYLGQGALVLRRSRGRGPIRSSR